MLEADKCHGGEKRTKKGNQIVNGSGQDKPHWKGEIWADLNEVRESIMNT